MTISPHSLRISASGYHHSNPLPDLHTSSITCMGGLRRGDRDRVSTRYPQGLDPFFWPARPEIRRNSCSTVTSLVYFASCCSPQSDISISETFSTLRAILIYILQFMCSYTCMVSSVWYQRTNHGSTTFGGWQHPCGFGHWDLALTFQFARSHTRAPAYDSILCRLPVILYL